MTCVAAAAAMLAGLGANGALSAQAMGPATGGAAALARAERMLGHTRRVLMIAAHPDDEDTELLTYLVREEGAESAYLSLTRGEGGQNLIGAELGPALGLLRSEELLAARELDGARQYFTRAYDFGYSKRLDETLTFWPRDTILKDVVRIVRRFQPQIIISIFSGTSRDGHGHHQAAGWAAREAFRVAGDPARFAELTSEEGLAPWTPAKLYRSTRFDTTGTTLVLDGGRLDAEIGQSYHQIAMRSRSLHRSQDMGMLQEIGPSPIRLALVADRTGAGSELFAGIDTGPPSPGDTGIVVRDLARHRAHAAAIRAGLVVDAISASPVLLPGDTTSVRVSVWNAGEAAVEAVLALEAPAGWRLDGPCLAERATIAAGAVRHCRVGIGVPAGAAPDSPYFLEHAPIGALYRWTGDPRRWGEPFEPPPLRAVFEITTQASEVIALERPVEHRARDQALGEVRSPLEVVPRVDVKITPAVRLLAVGSRPTEPVVVTLHHRGRDSTTGTVHLDLPPGWPPVAPQPFRFTRADERRLFTFAVAPPAGLVPGEYRIRAFARTADGGRFDMGVFTVSYPHITARRYTEPASMRLVAATVSLPSGPIGYVRGASDLVPEALVAVGMAVELLDRAALERADLSRYPTIVVGSRAYETEPALIENNGRLLEYVSRGGRLVVQYQQHAFFREGFAPFSLTVHPQHDRVTDERALVRLLEPEHPVFRRPNPIRPSDWDGWVQERGLYFARSWDARYRPLVATADPGEAPLRGGLLIAAVGQGSYVYTGLSFFRQLPAAVPGAFRLFMNLLDPESRAPVP